MKKFTRALGMLHFIPDALYLKMAYRLEMGARLNLKEPQGINEKLQWLKLGGAMGRFHLLADKLAVREHVKGVLGESYLVPVLGVYDRPRDIPWDQLPEKFVVKCTHGSGCNVIVTNKGTLNRRVAQIKLGRWLRRNCFWFGREPVYLNATPRIVIERFLGDGAHLPIDYKIMCFGGVPQVVQVHEKVGRTHTIGFFDVQGNKLPINKIGYGTGPLQSLGRDVLAPLLGAARKLAATVDTPYLRTDFYLVRRHLYFSELTFFDSSGFKRFEPESMEQWLGSLIDLNFMACPRCGRTMRTKSIEGSLRCDYVERYDQCPYCGHERVVDLEASS